MSQYGTYVPITIQAGATMTSRTPGTGALFKAVTMAGVPANNGATAIGLLASAGDSGDNVTVAIAGRFKYVAGAAVNSGQLLTVTTSGYVIMAVSGSHVVGRNLGNGVSSGMAGDGYFNGFANPPLLDSSSGHIHLYDFQSFTAQADLSAVTAGMGVNVRSGSLATPPQFFDGVLISGTVSGGTSWARTYGQAIALAAESVPPQFPILVASGGLLTVAVSGGATIGRSLTGAASGATFRIVLSPVRILTTSYA